ncbi:MAG TPA: DUF2975 domain-containing protein [Balneolaceae bacterium]
MDALGKKSAAYICYLIVNISWYISCLFPIIVPFGLLNIYLGNHNPEMVFGVTVPVDTSELLPDAIDKSYLAMKSAQVMIDFNYIISNSPASYIAWALFICIAIGLMLFGLYQLRALLKTAVHETVFNKANVCRIKTIAILIILIEPLSWIYSFIAASFDPIVEMKFELQILLIGLNFGYFLVGLLIYSLATVFERGYEIYQEQKLTV